MPPYRLPDSLDTPRHRLRRPVAADAQAIFDAYASDPQVTRFLGWRPHATPRDTQTFLRAVDGEWQRGTGAALLIFPQDDPGHLIGMIHPHLRGHIVTYGYVLRRDAWGQGIASEVLATLVTHALAHPAIFRCEAFCDAEHPASARVMEKAGMTREGLLRRYFRHPNLSDSPRDCILYARTKL